MAYRLGISLFATLLLLGTLLSTSVAVESSSPPALQNDILALFPKATVIGEPDSRYPVRPVYQLQELLGYVFESHDFVQLPGFSGDNINLLIGLDTEGKLRGIKILEHHEPIFIHGLGPEPLDTFIRQFVGKKINSRIIVDAAARDQDPNDNTHHIDGVTKATVSVIVISDTILLSALKVARQLLSGFASAPSASAKDTFTPMDWKQLQAKGYVGQLVLTQQQVADALKTPLEDFPLGTFDTEAGDEFTLYYAYLNAPSIGRNMLGDERYQRLLSSLKPNEQAFLFMSSGFMPFLSADFRPGTVADTITLVQNGLPMALRDLNFFRFELPQLAQGPRSFDDLTLFTVNSQSGFNPGQPMQLQLSMNVRKNHLSSVSTMFTHDYHLPAELFDFAEPQAEVAPTPAWVRIWQSRILDISILGVSLIIVTALFVYQHRISRHAQWFHRMRWAFLFYTFFFIGWYAQGQLSIVNIYPILHSVMNGFDIGVYLMDPILFILWSFVFISLFIVGRGVFCGWLCPFGALQEMVGWVAKKFRIRQWKISDKLHTRLWSVKYVILAGLVISSFFSLRFAEVASEVEPFKTAITLQFIRTWPFVIYAVLLLGIGLYVNKFYCRYVCPLGAGLAVVGYFHWGKWLTRREQCGSPCTMCYHKCDIKAITPKGEVNYHECVQCLECIVYYNNDDLCPPLKKQKKPLRAANVVVQQVL